MRITAATSRPSITARASCRSAGISPLLVNTVVGFIGPEYLFDGKQIIRAGLEDHFCGKLLGLPMGCDVCYTNHAEADQDDMDNLLTLCWPWPASTYVMGVPRRRRRDAELSKARPFTTCWRKAASAQPRPGTGIRRVVEQAGPVSSSDMLPTRLAPLLTRF